MPRYNGGFIGTDGLDAPDAPTIGTPSAGSTQADVAFTAGTAGTTATTEFVATTNDGIGATGTSSPITITGLTNGTSYTARVYAKNSHGTSAASEASASFTPLAEVISGLFSTFVYDGTGSAQTITNSINLSGKGGLVWTKQRSDSRDHQLYDTERGADKAIESSDTSAEHSGGTGVIAFNSNGFNLGTGSRANQSGQEFVSWTFRKEPKFFDVVKYNSSSGNVTNFGSAGATVNHNLGSVPGMILVKCTDTSSTNWKVYHRGLNGGTNPEQYEIELNQTGAQADTANSWNDTAPTSTQFTLGASGDVNNGSRSYVAYLFAHNNSDGGFGTDSEDIIKCGSYTGSSSDVSVDLGFEPQFVIVKNASTTSNWLMMDVMRGMPHGDGETLAADKSTAENGTFGTDNLINPTASGFIAKTGKTASNNNGSTIKLCPSNVYRF